MSGTEVTRRWMDWLAGEVRRQAKLTAGEPTRAIRLLRELLSQPGRLARYRSYISLKRKVGENWSADDSLGTQHRIYDTYDDYLEHQSSKLQHINLTDYDVWFRERLAARLSAIPDVRAGMSVLCLAARIGTEVKAFHDMGCFAVGIDLNPGQNNKFVLPGDFHDVQFPANCADVVYTNSIDHAFDVSRLLSEVSRVLKPEGLFMLEAQRGSDQGHNPEDYESFWWRSCDDLERAVVSCGFSVASRRAIDKPFAGVSLIFNVASQP